MNILQFGEQRKPGWCQGLMADQSELSASRSWLGERTMMSEQQFFNQTADAYIKPEPLCLQGFGL